MYSGRGFREWEIGDIDVIKHDGQYHLFHLVLPNHDYIAHAVSDDCVNWKRVKNALFVGDPGAWDDDMIWTMNVVAADEGFEMYYTGLSQRERGQFQRIGKAVSSDLYHWTKTDEDPFPIEPHGPHYETKVENVRNWVSFRDPYVVHENGATYLLVCARTRIGAISRRGCVGLVRLEEDKAVAEKPLFFPHVYDDVECPCLVKINDTYYLIGSIREDVKVHYWYCEKFQGDYHTYHNNVLMPKGNYAARVTGDGEYFLLYSFYVAGEEVETSRRYFCPPKELAVDDHGRLYLKSFHLWQRKIREKISQEAFPPFHPLLANRTASLKLHDEGHEMRCVSGYEIFCCENTWKDFIWRGTLHVVGLGKCGLTFNANQDGDGYFISIDAVQGYIQVRAWAKNPGDIFKDYQFDNLQTNNFRPNSKLKYEFQLIRYGHYIEVSIDGIVQLSLIDGRFNESLIGVYCESARVALKKSSLIELEPHEEEQFSDPFRSETKRGTGPA